MIAKKLKIKFIILQCMKAESLNALNEVMNTINDIDDFSFTFFKRQWFKKRLIFDESFNREQKIKLLHVKVKEFENFVV